ELEADVVIVGAGASGMVAAISAARMGASKVILLEKSCNVGGNALVSGGYLEYVNAPDELREDMTPSYEAELADELAQAPDYLPAEDLEKLMAEYEAWKESGSTKVFDSIYLHALQYALQGEGSYDEMLKTAENIAALDEWLVSEDFGFKSLCGIVGYSWPRWTSPKQGVCGQGYFTFYADEIERNAYPVEIYLNTPATELIVEDGTVAGVVAQGEDGTTYRVRGAQGVILATGGFSGSPDMLREYNTMWPFKEDEYIPTTNCYGHTGDGITMGLAAGGTVALMDVQMPFPMADCKNWTDETTVGDDVDCVIVNKEGKRFMNEVLDRYTMTENIMAQTDQMMFMVTDADTCRVDGENNRYGHSLQRLIDQGQLYRADTLEELAEQMGCDPAVLVDTVERYNEAARSGEDPEFGRTTFSELSPVEKAPFYASPRTWAMHITVGGLVVDIHDGYKVLDEAGQPIPGLRAIGETIVGSCGIGVQGEGLAVAKAMFMER
ncbi:MAG: FAD-dependent oxidoreductase, partial [Coriobacteriia bacterium]|nr:FAD-dependent oxidoreductase [Coriobacteriia bacterium]